ncbi:MAG: hypothetical protein DA408_08155 [Bacteroidetes bacterium]|nr:MAG: hypothetical protein C7N36_09735 [Bacteroidota bacterium]PTM13042.1 MAG: hypothetical protein DA408_08155 [Bacteroidota bacterium]
MVDKSLINTIKKLLSSSLVADNQAVTEFQKVELKDGALTWKNIEIEWLDETGKRVVDYYDLDSIVMYELSEADPSRGLEIGFFHHP